MSETYTTHCAACQGHDNLGRPCRGRSIPLTPDYRTSVETIVENAAKAEREKAERERLAEAVKAIPSGCHSHSGLSCEKDEYGWCYLVDRGSVLKLLEAERE